MASFSKIPFITDKTTFQFKRQKVNLDQYVEIRGSICTCSEVSHHVGQAALFDFSNESPKSPRLCHLPPNHLQRDVETTMLNGYFFHFDCILK